MNKLTPEQRDWLLKEYTLANGSDESLVRLVLNANTEAEDERCKTCKHFCPGDYDREQWCTKRELTMRDMVCSLWQPNTAEDEPFNATYYWEHMSEEHKHSVCEKIDNQIALRKIDEFEEVFYISHPDVIRVLKEWLQLQQEE